VSRPVSYLSNGFGTEQQLVAALQDGDEHSYRQLYERYAPALLKTLQRIFRDESVATDALQATFLIVFQKIDGFDARSSLKTWLTRIAIREARRQKLPARAPEEVDQLRESPACPERETIERQRARRLEVLIAALPTEKRIALLLFEIEGLSVQEIADINDEPRGTVLARLSRTRAELREAMLQWEGHDVEPARRKQGTDE
jgi:RNA polymerase sigma-70 factor (ECF subfamily)